MTKIFLDSCVWINYIWQTHFEESAKTNNSSVKLIEKIYKNNNYEIILSPFLTNEISTHFRDWFIMQKIIKDGFSYRDFSRERKNYSLTEEEKNEIIQIIISIGSADNINVLPVKNIEKQDIEEILNLESDYYFDFYDSLHVYTAVNQGCKFFITSDSPLRKSASKLKEKDKKIKIDFLPPSKYSILN